MEIQSIVHILVGPAGCYLRSRWQPNDVLRNMFRSADICVSKTVAAHIINGYTPFSHSYKKCYLSDNGITLLTVDLTNFVLAYRSISMIKDIQLRIHTAVAASDWPAEQIAELDKYYIVSDPSRDQIAVYIAHVMHAAITCS